MFGSIATYVFQQSERQNVVDAVRKITNTAFNRSGIYAFWDSASRELLYIGEAESLPNRLGQHLGLIDCEPSNCKSEQVKSMLLNHPEKNLGISICLRGPKPPFPDMNKVGLYIQDPSYLANFENYRSDFKDFLRYVEGALLATYKSVHKKLPAWNGNASSASGQKHGPRPDTEAVLIRALTGVVTKYSFCFLTHANILELANDEKFLEYEAALQNIRENMITLKISYDESLAAESKQSPDLRIVFDEIVSKKYRQRCPYPHINRLND